MKAFRSGERFLGLMMISAVSCSPGTNANLQTNDNNAQQTLSQGNASIISPKASSGLCLSSVDPKGANGAAVVVATCDGSTSQAWVIDSSTNTIRLFGGKCLDVIDGTSRNGARLQIWDCFDENNNQKWISQNGSWQWRNSGKCLDLTDGNKTSGAAVQIWDCAGGNDNQQWVSGSVSSPASPVGNSESDGSLPPADNRPGAGIEGTSGYISLSGLRRVCLDHPFAQYAGPTSPWIAQIMTCDYSGSQVFTAGKDGILTEQGGRCLTGDNTIDPLSGQVVLSFQECQPGYTAQQWDYVGGSWRNRKNKGCIEVVGNKVEDYTRIQLSACSEDTLQQWTAITDFNTRFIDSTASAATVPGKCSPQLLFTYRMDEFTKKKFKETIPNAESMVRKAIADDCNMLFDNAADVPAEVGFLAVSFDQNVGGGYTLGRNISLGWSVPSSVSSEKDSKYIDSTMHHEVGHFYQKSTTGAPGWVVEGMAEALPNMLGIAKSNPSRGGSYRDSYNTTAWFFIYIEKNYPGFIKQLERTLHDPASSWNDAVFKARTGKSVDQLWSDYQSTF